MHCEQTERDDQRRTDVIVMQWQWRAAEAPAKGVPVRTCGPARGFYRYKGAFAYCTEDGAWMRTEDCTKNEGNGVPYVALIALIGSVYCVWKVW